MEGLSAVAWHRPALGHRNRVALFPPRRPLACYPSTTMLQRFGKASLIVSSPGIQRYRDYQVLERIPLLLLVIPFLHRFFNMTEFA
jgi:hypothetical protein